MTDTKHQYYVEYYNEADEGGDLPHADTFHIGVRYLQSFLRKLRMAGNRIVYLRELEGKQRTLYNRRNVQFSDQLSGGTQS